MKPDFQVALPDPSQVPAVSQELLERARVGWERFISSFGDPSDD